MSTDSATSRTKNFSGVTRLAPSPTGALHLGNVRTFLINWALARQRGWKIILRIEDLDGPRIKAEAAQEAIEILQWLGLDWDEGPYYQLANLKPYQAALAKLITQNAIYPCRCTRREILAASLSAPHGTEHELRYPGTCDPRNSSSSQKQSDTAFENISQPITKVLADPAIAWRMRVTDTVTCFEDKFFGSSQVNIARTVGDFLVTTKGGLPSYQLAVVVDDAAQGVTHIVRGDDLLSSTPRQLLLYQQLNLTPRPTYYHLPLVQGEDGRRLAKRHGDTRVSTYRTAGVSANRILGLMAQWCGISNQQTNLSLGKQAREKPPLAESHLEMREEITIQEFLKQFSLTTLSPQPILFTTADHRWLLG